MRNTNTTKTKTNTTGMSNTIQISRAYAVTDEEVIGTDYEAADVGNPNGYRYGRRVRVHAETKEGRCFIHSVAFDEGQRSKASALAAKVEQAGEINYSHWGETYESYGSEAWQAADDQRAFEHCVDPARAGTCRDY